MPADGNKLGASCSFPPLPFLRVNIHKASLETCVIGCSVRLVLCKAALFRRVSRLDFCFKPCQFLVRGMRQWKRSFAHCCTTHLDAVTHREAHRFLLLETAGARGERVSVGPRYLSRWFGTPFPYEKHFDSLNDLQQLKLLFPTLFLSPRQIDKARNASDVNEHSCVCVLNFWHALACRVILSRSRLRRAGCDVIGANLSRDQLRDLDTMRLTLLH